MSAPRTDVLVLAQALDILARGIDDHEGLATGAISEAAQRLRELAAAVDGLAEYAEDWVAHYESAHAGGYEPYATRAAEMRADIDAARALLRRAAP